MPPVVISLLDVPGANPAAALAANRHMGVASLARKPSGRPTRKPRCEDCFFHQNMLCALPDKKLCPTFRPAHPDGLKPPQQLSFVFRQERRTEPFLFVQPAGA
jgi:hypothetical protein